MRRHISHPYRLTALLPGLTVLVLQQTADSRGTTKRLYMKASSCSWAEGQCGDLGVEGPAETHTSCHTDALNVVMEACISMTHVGVRLGVGVGVYVCVIRGTIEAAS